MKSAYALAALVAVALAGCKAEVTPSGSTGTTSTTVVKEKPADSTTANTTVNVSPSPSTSSGTTVETTKSVDTPAGTATSTTTTTTK
jgi:hypothetical protein